jgi:major membrane immunogen (membrane-anchored lipoprotein)
MDFSTISEGLTMINIAPSLTTGFGIGDNRNATSTDETFNAHFRLTGWGKGAMKKNETRTARIALYIHEPGGYEMNKDIIDLIVKIGETEDEAINTMATYRGPSAKDFARQALLSARSAYEEIFAGDVVGAKSLLEEASGLIKRAEDAENSAVMVNNLIWLIPLLIVVATLVILYVRKKKRRSY